MSGEIVYKFNHDKISFTEIPKIFQDHLEYKQHWLYLIQFEIYSKLLSRSSNKSQKMLIKEEED